MKDALRIVRERRDPDWVLLRLAAIDVLAMARKLEIPGAPSLPDLLSFLDTPTSQKTAVQIAEAQYAQSACDCAQILLRHVDDDEKLRAALLDSLGIASRLRAMREDDWAKRWMKGRNLSAQQADMLDDIVLSLAPQFGSLVSEKADDWRYQLAFAFSAVRVLEYQSDQKKDFLTAFGRGRFRRGHLEALRELQSAPEDPESPLGFLFQRVADRLLARLGEPRGLAKRRREAKAIRSAK